MWQMQQLDKGYYLPSNNPVTLTVYMNSRNLMVLFYRVLSLMWWLPLSHIATQYWTASVFLLIYLRWLLNIAPVLYVESPIWNWFLVLIWKKLPSSSQQFLSAWLQNTFVPICINMGLLTCGMKCIPLTRPTPNILNIYVGQNSDTTVKVTNHPVSM